MNRAFKRIAALSCACLILLCAFGCAPSRAPIAPQDSLSIRPSDEDVADFLAILGDDAPAMYGDDACYNITPDFIAENSDYRVFKFSQSCASFVLYDGKAYQLGEFLGGTGADSFALADLDGDGAYELYFTFSWGSGFHRSQVGHFDPAAKAVTVFDAAFFNEDCMLTLGANKTLEVRRADISYGADDGEFYVSFDLLAGDALGTLAYEDGAVQFLQTEDPSAI